jgi:hypothetical protein
MWAKGYAAAKEAQRAELEWHRDEIERLRTALRALLNASMYKYHPVESQMAIDVLANQQQTKPD